MKYRNLILFASVLPVAFSAYADNWVADTNNTVSRHDSINNNYTFNESEMTCVAIEMSFEDTNITPAPKFTATLGMDGKWVVNWKAVKDFHESVKKNEKDPQHRKMLLTMSGWLLAQRSTLIQAKTLDKNCN